MQVTTKQHSLVSCQYYSLAKPLRIIEDVRRGLIVNTMPSFVLKTNYVVCIFSFGVLPCPVVVLQCRSAGSTTSSCGRSFSVFTPWYYCTLYFPVTDVQYCAHMLTHCSCAG
jgi:hypothetical protein